MKVYFPRFAWLMFAVVLAVAPGHSYALVNTSDPSDNSAEPTPTPTAQPDRSSPEDAQAAPTPDQHAQASPPAAPMPAVPITTPPPSGPSVPPVPDHFQGPKGNVYAGPGDHHVEPGEAAHDVVSVLGNSTADVDIQGAVVAVLGNSDAHKTVSDAVVAVLGNSHAEGDVGQSVVAVLGNASANGHVHQNVVAVLGNVDLGPHAEVDGDVVSVGGEIHVAPGAIIHGHRSMTTPVLGAGHLPFAHTPAWFQHCLFQGRYLAFRSDVAWAWIPALIFLGCYFLIGLMFSNGVRRCAETFEERPGWAILATLLTVVLAPLLTVLLLIFGVIGGIFLAIALMIAAFFGKAALFGWLGRRIYRDSSPLGTALAVLIGGLIFLLLYTIPVVAFVAWLSSAALGLGLVVYTLVLSMRKPPVAPVPIVTSPSAWPTPPVASVSIPGNAVVAGGNVSSVSPTAGSSVPPAGSVAQPLPLDPNAASAGVAQPGVSIPASQFSSAAAGSVGVPPSISNPAPGIVVSAVTLPRATFGPRLLAALLDLVLVGFFAHLLHMSGLFLLLYTAYCVCLWTLKGTTIGGIICGLKLVRLDDRPIDWSIALIRALGAYLSLIVVGLGFLWVNFDDECQSWHDKIAGTTIVRVPKGHSLV